MAKIGSFGKVVFEVSDKRIKTPTRLEKRLYMRLAEHEIAYTKNKLEVLGEGLSEVTLRIRFSVELGVNPKEELKTLEELLTQGEAQILMLGDENLGKYVIEEIRERVVRTDNKGNVLSAEVEIRLREYK